MPRRLVLLAAMFAAVPAFAAASRPDAAVPVTQQREVYGKRTWLQRHDDILAYHRKVKPELVFIGDSITHFRGANRSLTGKTVPRAGRF